MENNNGKNSDDNNWHDNNEPKQNKTIEISNDVVSGFIRRLGNTAGSVALDNHQSPKSQEPTDVIINEHKILERPMSGDNTGKNLEKNRYGSDYLNHHLTRQHLGELYDELLRLQIISPHTEKDRDVAITQAMHLIPNKYLMKKNAVKEVYYYDYYNRIKSNDIPSEDSRYELLLASLLTPEKIDKDIAKAKFNTDDFQIKNKIRHAYIRGKLREIKSYNDSTVDLVNAFLDTSMDGMVGDFLDDDEEVLKTEQKAILDSIEKGDFLPRTIVENPAAADKLLEEKGISKDDMDVVWRATDNYTMLIRDRKERRADVIERYYDISEKIYDDVCAHPSEYNISKNLLISHEENYRRDSFYIPTSLTQKVVNKIKDITQELQEKLTNDDAFHEALEKDKEKYCKAEYDKLADLISKWQPNYGENLDLMKYLNIASQKSELSEETRRRIRDKLKDEPLAGFVMKSNDYDNILGELATCKMDYKTTMRSALLDRLATGTYKKRLLYYGGARVTDVSDVYESEEFKKVQEILDLDFDNSDVYDKALVGLMNVLKNNGGTSSEQAKWYYENILSRDQQYFMTWYRTTYEESDKGLKNRLTRFLNSIGISSSKNEKMTSPRDEQKSIVKDFNDIEEIETITEGKFHDLIQRRKDLLEKLKGNNSRIDNFEFRPGPPEDESESSGNGVGTKNNSETQKYIRSVEFGILKVETLYKQAKLIENENGFGKLEFFAPISFANSNNTQEDTVEAVFDSRKYCGFVFEYLGKKCMVAESFGDPAAMYIVCLNEGDDYKSVFNNSKFVTMNLPNAKRVKHFGRDGILQMERIGDAMVGKADYFDIKNLSKSMFKYYASAMEFIAKYLTNDNSLDDVEEDIVS